MKRLFFYENISKIYSLMSDNQFSLSRILINEETQTSVSLYTDPQVFNINSDKNKLDVENSLYQFKYSIEDVERLVSAVHGNDVSNRNKGRIIRPKSKRFNKLLTSLRKQIQTNSRYLHTHREQKILVERLIRSLAYAIDPASRKGKSKQNQRIPLFAHQKYEHSMKLGAASLFFENSQTFGDENKDYDIVFSYQNSLCLINDSYIFVFDSVSPNSLVSGKEFPIAYRKNSFGSLILYDYQSEGEDGQPKNEENESVFANQRVIMPIIDDDRTLYLVHALGGSDSGDGQEINLKTLINPYDFSFIDVVLSIPRMTSSEATNFLIFLYKENYLSAYVRSKLCQFLYENRVPDKEIESETLSVKRSSKTTQVKVNLKKDLITNSLKSREWPELLGRFISLLDHNWFIEAAYRMEHLELPQVVKSIAKSSDKNSDSKSAAKSASNPVSSINSVAQYLLGIILWEFEELDRGDSSEFIWEFLCKSVFANLYLNKNDEKSIQKRQKLEALFLGTKEKPATSKTRIVTQKAVERIGKTVRSIRLDDILPKKLQSPKSKSKSNTPKSIVETFNSHKFLLSLIKNHRDEIITILKNIPRTTEEASPLFYPIALEVRDALYSHFNDLPKARTAKSHQKEDQSYEEGYDEIEIENNRNRDIKSSKNKARASSLQNTNKSSKKQPNRKNNYDDQYYDDDDDDEVDYRRKNKNKSGQRAASVSQNSQSSSNSKPLGASRPSPLHLKKQGIPINSKKNSRIPQNIPRPNSNKKQTQKKQYSDNDDYEYEIEYEYEENVEKNEYDYEYE